MMYAVMNPEDVDPSDSCFGLARIGIPVFMTPTHAMEFLSRLSQHWDEEVYEVWAASGDLDEIRTEDDIAAGAFRLSRPVKIAQSKRVSSYITFSGGSKSDVLAALVALLSLSQIPFSVKFTDGTGVVQVLNRDRKAAEAFFGLAYRVPLSVPQMSFPLDALNLAKETDVFDKI